MSYRLQLPRREQDSRADIVVTPEVRERRKTAMSAFAAQLRRLASLFPNGLEGLDADRPDVWAEIKATEERVDHVALGYIEGRESKVSFDRALRAYELAWQRGAQVLANRGRGERG
jgi:hypothetical protein